MVAKLHPMVAGVRYLSAEEIDRRLADAEEKHRRDIEDRVQGAYEEGFKIGFEKGFEKGFKIGLQKVALQFLRKKWSHEEIAEITDLSIDEIRHLESTHSSQQAVTD